MTKTLRLGVYAGSFDPVHSGHIAFALQARQAARLDEVIFLPERRPRYKTGVEHYGHRMAMLERALRPHPHFGLLETVDRQFSVQRTLPQLQALWPEAELVLLMGSDTLQYLPTWPYVARLLKACELVIGVRQPVSQEAVTAQLARWQQPPIASYVLASHAPTVSSSHIRTALRANQPAAGLLASVKGYARREWLYVAAPA